MSWRATPLRPRPTLSRARLARAAAMWVDTGVWRLAGRRGTAPMKQDRSSAQGLASRAQGHPRPIPSS
eukprot:9502463-Alexandrium_andersonii.AAC.1